MVGSGCEPGARLRESLDACGQTRWSGCAAGRSASAAGGAQGGVVERRQAPLVAVTAQIPAASQCWPVWLLKKRQIIVWLRYRTGRGLLPIDDVSRLELQRAAPAPGSQPKHSTFSLCFAGRAYVRAAQGRNATCGASRKRELDPRQVNRENAFQGTPGADYK